MHTCWSKTQLQSSDSDRWVWIGSTLDRRVKVFLLQKAASLTDSTDTKEEDSLFSHRYLCLAPSTSPCSKKKLQSLVLLTGGTWTPDIAFNRGAQLHLRHCQSQNATELQACRRRANQQLMFPPAKSRADYPWFLSGTPELLVQPQRGRKTQCLPLVVYRYGSLLLAAFIFLVSVRRTCS